MQPSVQQSELAIRGEGDSRIDALMAKLRAIHRNTKLMLATDIGHLIVEELYDGNVETLRMKGRTHDGYRTLASHPNLPMSKSTLWRYVRVYELTTRMKWIVRSTLTVAHLTAVLGLEHDEQERLLRTAVYRGWSFGELTKELGANRSAPARSAPVMKIVRRVKKLNVDPAHLGQVRDLAEAEKQQLREAVQRTRAWCEALEAWLHGEELN